MRSFVVLLLLASATHAGTLPPEQVEFFEQHIRPVLAQECYECHSTAGKKKGGLLLDSREGWMHGGDSGEAIIPGNPRESLLLQSIRHEDPDLKMPSKGAKLEPRVLENFEKWIALGAPDPRDQPPSKEELEKDTDWNAVRERRKGWWSFQPITDPQPEAAAENGWSMHTVDRFLLSAMGKVPGVRARISRYHGLLQPVGAARTERPNRIRWSGLSPTGLWRLAEIHRPRSWVHAWVLMTMSNH